MQEVRSMYVYHGSGKNYQKPARFRYNEVLKNHPSVKSAFAAKSAGKFVEYSICTSKMSEIVQEAVKKFASENDYDLITNYHLEEAVDITEDLRKIVFGTENV